VNTAHWSKQKEISSGYFNLKLMLFLFKIIPAPLIKLCAFPVSFFYYITSKRVRAFSRCFLNKIFIKTGKKYSSFLHIFSFSLSLIEKMEAWNGKLDFGRIRFPESDFRKNDIAELIESIERKQGAVLICSHLGNAEMLRALANFNQTGVSGNVSVTSIVDFSVTANFNKMLKKLAPDSMTSVMNAGQLGLDTAVTLLDRAVSGELIVIAGDRTSAFTKDVFSINFLGGSAAFPLGVFLLASMLDVPVYFVFAFRKKDIMFFPKYDMYVHKNTIQFDCPRKERRTRLFECASDYAKLLEHYCKIHPYQWYNFYDFWTSKETEAVNG
jgi:predicted LPLAT superfamily acyltransferase